ncbi:flavoprotein [Lactifluus volemus]|nr:flavoprotein [Lactifluus volemus]
MAGHFTAAANRREGHTHVLLITTGSVASIKAPLIVEEFLKYKNVSVQVATTKPSLTFFQPEDIRKQGVQVWTDDDEWDPNYRIGDPILHIELRRWADVVLIAPCSANTLAKIANGVCDNLVTSLLRALAPTTPTYVFPAMNTLMYEHPLTALHVRTIREVIGYNVVGPISKNLACGDLGIGAMVEWRDIVAAVVERFLLVRDSNEDDASTRPKSLSSAGTYIS